jgi:hypothetical protein
LPRVDNLTGDAGVGAGQLPARVRRGPEDCAPTESVALNRERPRGEVPEMPVQPTGQGLFRYSVLRPSMSAGLNALV